MNRRLLLALAALAIGAGACSNLGLGEPECVPPERDISSANILNVQAVPAAKYTPCLNELKLGWDSVSFFAENGRAGIEIHESVRRILVATVAESCDVSGATAVESGYEDIEKFEDVEFQRGEIEVTIVPSAERPLVTAQVLVAQYADAQVDDRPVVLMIDDNMERSVTARVDSALDRGQYAWIIDELDAEEGTVEMRSNIAAIAGSGLRPAAALELIEDFVPEVRYEGSWYFIFEGGCKTYEFDVKGRLAETVADDITEALGFYPASELRRFAEEAGFTFE